MLGSRLGDVVLDPYAGSGTTLVAAASPWAAASSASSATKDYVEVARARVAAAAAPRRPVDPRSTASGPKDPRKSQPTAPGRLTAGELFAGVGGFRLGLGRSGWDTVFSNQWEPGTATQHASECYVHNFGDEGHHNEDITTLLDRGLDDTTVIPELTLLCGGFPCVDYSVAKPLSQSKGLQGEKGQLWWQVHRLLEHRRPPLVLLENVDRLLKSPAQQRGRDFAVIVRSLTDLGYTVEWRVVNAADYGFAQRRRRVFIVATDTKVLPTSAMLDAAALIGRSGVLARALPVEPIDEDALSTFSIDGTLEEVGRCFGAGLKRSPFLDAGFAVGHLVRCCTPTPDYHGPLATLGSVLLDERLVPKRFFIGRNKLPSWRYLKGAKRLNRTRPDGSGYIYTEGAVAFPDAANRASRTLLTSEGSSSASRTTHVVRCGNRRHRRLTPVELERLNGFPDEWTKLQGEGVENSDVRRGFLMGNALVVGLVERIGEVLAADWKARVATAPVPPTVPMPLNSIAQEQAAPYGTYTPVEERRAA